MKIERAQQELYNTPDKKLENLKDTKVFKCPKVNFKTTKLEVKKVLQKLSDNILDIIKKD